MSASPGTARSATPAHRHISDHVHRLADARGQALVELALVAPFLILVIMGIIELGAAVTTHLTILNACREGARIAARGGIYPDSDILLVIEGHSASLDLQHHGSIIVTSVTSNASGVTSFNCRSLLGTQTSRFTQDSLAALHVQASTANPNYLADDHFVVVEVFYNYHTITGFLTDHLDMYEYTIMPVSAPS